MNNRYTADVVVIGGGIMGTSIAYHLAREKVRVILIEKKDLASEASGACGCLISMQSKKPGLHLKLALASKKRFEVLKDELPVDIEYRNHGGMIIIESKSEMDAMHQFVAERQKSGLEVTLLDTNQSRELEPFLSNEIIGSTFSPMDAQVNPFRLVHSYAKGARQLGVQIMTETRACGIEIRNGLINAVDTNRGSIETPVVVNAAGIYAPEVGRWLDLEIPIIPRRGQIIVTEKTSPMVKRDMLSASYFTSKFNPELAKTGEQGVSIEQTVNGNFLLGTSLEFVGFDRSTTPETLRRIAQHTSKIIPELKNIQIIRSFAGLRPYTPDGLPILGPVNSLPGFFMAAGHQGDGISLSAITGMLMAQQIIHNKPEIPLDDFNLDRFHKRSKAAFG